MKTLTGLSVLVILFFASCGKDQSLIPDVYVDFNVPVNDPRVNAFQGSSGNVVMIDNYGVAGLILYKKLSNNMIVAYDRCSTVNPEQKNKLHSLGGALVEDRVSGAQFNLEDGAAVKAPGKRSLKRYSVSINGGMISVYN